MGNILANELQPEQVYRHPGPHWKEYQVPVNLPLHAQTLEVVDGSKYLGVTVTDNLSWSRHVSDTAGKAQRSLGFLRRNFKHCSRQVKAATFTSVVRPVLEYASPMWDPYRQADIKALEQVQRREARYVYNDYTSRTPGCVRHSQRAWMGKPSGQTPDFKTLFTVQKPSWFS